MSGGTVVERLARIEALITSTSDKVAETNKKLVCLERELRADKEELQALKNKGAGILAGVALAAGGLSAAVAAIWRQVIGG